MSYWFVILFWSICLEGLGRKYIPAIPSIAFYVLKDVILLFGLLKFRPSKLTTETMTSLYGSYRFFWVTALGFTVVQLFNPEQASLPLGLLGLRAYWLWWVAPVVVAGVLQNPKAKRAAIYLLIFTSIGIAALAAAQFASPPTSAINLYSVVNGEEIYADMATVHSTGRARVSGTFSFLSGFVAFTLLVPALLLSIGMSTEDKTLRKWAFVAMAATAAVLPMSGSRGPVILGVIVLAITAWTAGLFFTRAGRRTLIGVLVAVVLAVTAFPDALGGVQDRFSDTSETTSRLLDAFQFLPPVALSTVDYPVGGIGTGMMQNARFTMGGLTSYWCEGENGRYLVELGVVGFFLVWAAKLGLCVALFRCYRILKRAGRRAAAGSALSYTFLTMVGGNLVFDHVWQALFFTGAGFILAEVVSVRKQQAEAAAPVVPAVLPVRVPAMGFARRG